MAEGILQHLLRDADVPVRVHSAGTAAPEGARPSREAVAVAGEHGLDISGIRSRQLTRGLLDEADLVLVMEPHHKAEVLAMAPSMDGKVHVLSEFVGEGEDEGVEDPLGRGKEAYEETFGVLESLLLKAAPRILELARRAAGARKRGVRKRGESPPGGGGGSS
jgi:protein-tyrosine phosphatase